jgi:Ca-activated chloride channel family protein
VPTLILNDPLWLLALLLIPVALWLRGRRAVPVLLVPFAAAWHRRSISAPSRWAALLAGLGLVLFTIALARPQRREDRHEVHSQGYDLMLCIDLSGSMLSEDYVRDDVRINRLQAIQPVIKSFINQRPNDRIGVVVFSGYAYTLAPLTFDHDWLAGQVDRLKIGLIEDGTSIGDGIGIALTRLEQAAHEENGRRKGAFIVLLTDGANNRGALTPEQATQIAKSRGIPIYTIGAGKDGMVPFPRMTEDHQYILDRYGQKQYVDIPADLDEGALKQIAAETGGKFFRAGDTGTVEGAFKSIDQAQKIVFQTSTEFLTTELFHWFALPGLACMSLAALVGRRAGRDGAGAPTAGKEARP